MNEYELHQKIKYGDIIYIEFTYQKKRARNILTGGEFNLKGKFEVEIKKLNLTNNSIYLKDFEENLFIIFPKMKVEFNNNKTFLNKSLSMIKERINSTSKKVIYDSEFKNDITKIIQTFQETKQNVYTENEKLMEKIGTPINYEDDFILIHFKSQCFVKRNDKKINNKSSALILSQNYSEDCIFFFAQFSSFNLHLKYVFSNQNLLICKREKNVWINSHYLVAKPINSEKNIKESKYESNFTNNPQNNIRDSLKYENNTNFHDIKQINNKYILDFDEGQGQAFQIKVCSNYIDPSSSNLSFATPVWLEVQSVDKYLNITTSSKMENIINDFNYNIDEINNNYARSTIKSSKDINNNMILKNSLNKLHHTINSNANYSNITRQKNSPKKLKNITNNNNNNEQNNINNNSDNINQKIIENNQNSENYHQKTSKPILTNYNQKNNKNINKFHHKTEKLNSVKFKINSHTRYFSSNLNRRRISDNHNSLFNYRISFESTDKEKSISSINGLFFIEQYDETTTDIQSLTDAYLKEKLQYKLEIKMPPYIEFHKTVRFRHITTKKYLGFEEKINDDINKENLYDDDIVIKNGYKGKTNGSLILMDVPNDNCNWLLLESYKVIQHKNYLKSKMEGIKPREKEKREKEEKVEEKKEKKKIKEEREEEGEEEKINENENEEKNVKEKKKHNKEEKKEIIHKIKNNEILRIFHIKSQKFLCFDEVNNKFGDKIKNNTLIGEELYHPKIEKKIYVHNLTLSKVPFDSDLVRLIPFDVNQSFDISIILYFNKQLTEQIDFFIKKDFRKLLGIDNYKSLLQTIEPSIIIHKNTKISNNNINSYNDNDHLMNNNINSNNDNNIQNKYKTSINKFNYNKDFINIDYYKNKKKFINDLKGIRSKTLQLIESFKDITDYCLNNFSTKYDINISPGKPLYYRQQFLYDQGLFKKTFKFLEYTKNLNEIYNDYIEFSRKKFEEEEAEKINKTLHINIRKTMNKRLKSFENKNVFDLNNNPDYIILEIFRNINDSIKLGFEFIYAMCKNNNNNKKIAFNHKKLFLYYFLEYEEASNCFMDLLKENENIMNLVNKSDIQEKKTLDNLESDSEEDENNIVDKILLYLNKSKNYETKNLSLLSKFLIIGDTGITSNQQYIFERLFYKGKDRFLIKIKPLYKDIDLRVVYKDENKYYVEKSLEDFCKNRILQDQGTIKYLAEQLNLYANLCYGRNYVCIEKIRKIFPLDHLIYHISKIHLDQEIIAGLVNILNYVYIDIEPHIMNVYPTLIKRVSTSLRIERISKDKVKTYIPLNKLNLILCLSLFLLNNIKYGSTLVNIANINMIYNIIKFHLFDNVVYSPMNIDEVINNNLDQRLHNLKDEVKYNIINGEEFLINKKSGKNHNKKEINGKNDEIIDEISGIINEEEKNPMKEMQTDDFQDSEKKNVVGNVNSFYNKYGYKFIDFNFEKPIGEEYILLVLDKINDFFLHNLILNITDNNTENKNIISQNFKSVSSNDILTQSNINYLMKVLIDIKNILTKKNDELKNIYILILKQIEKVINYIMDIKAEDMSAYLLENLLKINYQLIAKTFEDNENVDMDSETLYGFLKEQLFSIPNIKDILLDNEFYYYQLFNKINYYDEIPKFFSNSLNSNDNEILGALLKRDKNPEENKRLLSNSLFDDDSSLIENNYTRLKEIHDLTNSYFYPNTNYVNEGYHDSDYYYNLNMPKLEIDFENFFMNSVIFKNTIELIIRILELNVNAKMMKILLRIFKRLISQKKELFDCIKNAILLYKNDDLQKYYLCYTSIKELALLSEKTEEWMTEDHVPNELKNMKQPYDLNLSEIEEDKKDFFLVYSTINKYLTMIIDSETNTYYKDDEVNLIQKIFYSFQMEKILSSLMKEIIQEYPKAEINISNNNTLEISKYIRLSRSYNSKSLVRTFLEKQKRKKNKIDKNKKEKELTYKISLEKLIKLIFKLFLALIHNTFPKINNNIIELVDFSKEYKFLFNFGLLRLIVELSKDEKYVLYHTNYLLDLINDQINIEYIKSIKSHLNDYQTFFQYDDFNVISPKGNSTIYSKRGFKKILKKYSFLFKLMKNVTSKLNEEKYLGTLLQKYEEIIFQFDQLVIPINQSNVYLMNTFYPKDTKMIDDKRKELLGTTTATIISINTYNTKTNDKSFNDLNNKVGYYILVFIYYLIKISCCFIKKNQQIKQYILNIFNKRHLIKFIFDLNHPFSEEQINYIIETNQYKESKIFLKIQYYFKVKYIGSILILSLSKNLKDKRKYFLKDIEKYYSRLNEDLDYVFYFNNQIENYGKFNQKLSNYYIVYEKYRKSMYKYFFKGMFQLIYYHLSLFREKLFKSHDDYQRVKNTYIIINRKWLRLYLELNNEKDKNAFKNLFIYLGHKKKEIKNLLKFNNSPTNFISRIETKTINYISNIKQNLVGPEETKLITLLQDPKQRSDFLFDMTINFVNDIINEIENYEVISKCIIKEKKIMAKHLKTKINFHSLLKKYVQKETQTQTTQTENEAEIHLVNVFIRFIQENADNKKYFPVIKELIELMAYIVSVTPEIIKPEYKIEKNDINYFDQKVLEFKENFFYEYQKSFLNNGAIEIFLKSACQDEKYFQEKIFNMIIFFFNTILQGGNKEIQKKFIQLFQLLPNSDNFFKNIYQSFNKDIFYNLNDDPFIEEISKDNKNLKIINDKLRFLQLLTENHNLFLQNYLREQKNNRISYNFINILIEYLSMLLEKLGNLNDKYKNLPSYYIELYYKRLLFLLDTISEFLQGPCKQNQENLINTKVVELFNKIMDETCIINDNENQEAEINNEDNYFEQNTVFILSNRKNNLDTFFSDNITYTGTTLEEDLFPEEYNLPQNKIFSSLSDFNKSMLLFKISLVLLSIIEGRKKKDSVIKKILRDINYKLVFQKCGEIYTKLKNEMYFFLFTEQNMKEIENLEDKVVSEAGFNLYFLMENLVSLENEETELKVNSSFILECEKNYDKLQKEKLQEIFTNAETIQEAIHFYSENSLSIEILKEDEIFKVYCPKLQFFNSFDDKMKKELDDDADRTSVQSKLTYLINKKEQLYMTLKQTYILDQRYSRFGFLKYILTYPHQVQFIGLILIIIMNILILFGYNAEKDKDKKHVIYHVNIFGLNEKISNIFLRVLGIIILCFIIIIFIEFITKDAVLIYKNLYRNYLKNSYEKKIGSINDFEIHRIYDFLKSSETSLFFNKLFIYLKLLSNFHVIYTLIYIVSAILGFFLHPFFYSILLIEFIKNQPILIYVFLAFYEPLVQFVYTLIFFFILIYFYSLFIFYNYFDLMPENTCDSPLICMTYIYSNTFTSGGNLGNFIDTKEESMNISGNMKRYILDISYTIIMVWLVWQMVTGLIVDTFDSLRGDREELEEDMETICFICGLNREKIEKYYIGKEGFEKHLQDHSIENYLFYMFYLEEKDPNEYSGLESYVKENIDKESIVWFPIERSLKIEEWENRHKV